MGADVFDHHPFPCKGGGATTTDALADFEAVDRFGIKGGQTGAGTVQEAAAGLVEQQNRAAGLRRFLLDDGDDRLEDRGQIFAGRDLFEDVPPRVFAQLGSFRLGIHGRKATS